MSYQFDGSFDRHLSGTGTSSAGLFEGGGTTAWWFKNTGLGESNYPRWFGQACDTGGGSWAMQLRYVTPQQRLALVYPFDDSGRVYGVWHGDTDIIYTTSPGWNHGAIAYNADSLANDASLWLNGVAESVTEAATPTGTAAACNGNVVVGSDETGLLREYNGHIAEIGMWDEVLTTSEVAALAAGVSPLSIRPSALVKYFPLIRDLQDHAGGETLTANNGPTISVHPRIIRPSAQILQFPAATAASGLSLSATLVSVAVADLNAAVNNAFNLNPSAAVSVAVADLNLADTPLTRELSPAAAAGVAVADLNATLITMRDVTATTATVSVADINSTVVLGADRSLTATLVDVAVADVNQAVELSRELAATVVNVAVADENGTITLDANLNPAVVNVYCSAQKCVLTLAGSVGLRMSCRRGLQRILHRTCAR